MSQSVDNVQNLRTNWVNSRNIFDSYLGRSVSLTTAKQHNITTYWNISKNLPKHPALFFWSKSQKTLHSLLLLKSSPHTQDISGNQNRQTKQGNNNTARLRPTLKSLCETGIWDYFQACILRRLHEPNRSHNSCQSSWTTRKILPINNERRV